MTKHKFKKGKYVWYVWEEIKFPVLVISCENEHIRFRAPWGNVGGANAKMFHGGKGAKAMFALLQMTEE